MEKSPFRKGTRHSEIESLLPARYSKTVAVRRNMPFSQRISEVNRVITQRLEGLDFTFNDATEEFRLTEARRRIHVWCAGP